MAFIRPFKPEDTESAKHICRATLPPTLLSTPAAVRMAPYLWTLQFTHLFPQNCFVLDDGEGKAVGYVIGAPDVFALEARYPRFVEEVLEGVVGRGEVGRPEQLDKLEEWWLPDEQGVNPACLAQMAYNVRWLLLEGVEGKKELVQAYRAMLHIDLLPEWQGGGWGRKMIEKYVEGVQASGMDYGKGIHLGVAGENSKVVKFYERVGFRVYPGGEREGNVWMVRDL